MVEEEDGEAGAESSLPLSSKSIVCVFVCQFADTKMGKEDIFFTF